MNSSLPIPIYTLVDLLKDKVSGFFYKEQLTKCPAPNYKTNFFEVEKVLKTKTINKKKYFLCKFLYYSNKFNQYIPEENFKN